jgi:transposase
MVIRIVGLDIAKHVFQVHAADAAGRKVAQLRLRRAQVLDYFRTLAPCLVGMEACATAHYWARELAALGHEVRLMPPAYVKPYVKRNKTDAADAEAIAEAITRPTMRFVPVKTADQQSALMLHRARELLVRQRTMLATALRAHLAEFGIVAPQGIHRVEKLVAEIHNPAVPCLAREVLKVLADELAGIWQRVEMIEARLVALHRANDVSHRLASIPGIGPITAMAIASTVPEPSMFRSGREFAAWLGLTPKSHSSGGKDKLGGISKRGDRYIRHLLYVGAGNAIRFAKARAATGEAWIRVLFGVQN